MANISDPPASISENASIKHASTRSSGSAREDYQARLEIAKEALSQLRVQHVQMVWFRTGCFLLAVVFLFLGYGGESYRALFQAIGWFAIAAFVVAIARHEHLRLKTLSHESDQRLFERLMARLDRNWSALPEQRLLPQFSELTFADDLDVAGNASLLSLLCLAGTQPGRRTVQAWVANHASWPEVKRRQQAVKALVECRDLRLSIVKTVWASSDGSEDVYGLPRWASGPKWLPKHRLAHVLSYLGPTLVLLGICLVLVAVLVGSKNPWLANTAAGTLAAGFVVNILLTVVWGSWIHDIFHQVTGTHQATFQFADVFHSFSELPHDGGLLDEIRRTATEDPNSAKRGFEKLLWAVRLANLQRDPTLYVVYLGLQLLFAWDFRVLKLLEQWKDRFGQHVDGWFCGLGNCEALISGATLADEYRQWVFPEPTSNSNIRLRAEGLGHPLLSDGSRVENDLTLDSAQPLLLVTGSNMAGKSTFLRALGLNLLLARSGAPVCASRLATPLYDLATSIRVRDSLRDGVSFFMAELKRLKEVVDMAHARAEDHESPILFLLDEILQGTNSRERQLAVTSVIEQLLNHGACGLLSTHDLDLATVEEVRRVSQIVHFREYFDTVDGQEVMRFDYKMRPGPTPTTNAMKLLKMVGLH